MFEEVGAIGDETAGLGVLDITGQDVAGRHAAGIIKDAGGDRSGGSEHLDGIADSDAPGLEHAAVERQPAAALADDRP